MPDPKLTAWGKLKKWMSSWPVTACTVGSLVSKIKVECLVVFIQEIACDERPQQKLKKIVEMLENNVVKLRPSSKHMAGR
ncbi:hypothetical protein, partial [Desulfobacula sp.]|uniref:hypothetical protein n=1 Tax=Desulfobacula sp. TaxID=2593537 RepID=UPI0026156B12